jgi:nucleoside-diphosphate-sugar epimerase
MAVAKCDAALGNVVNLGVGEEISIGDLAALCMEIVGHEAQLVTDEDRARPSGSEVERLLSDNSRARDWAGWSPQVTLRSGLEQTAHWVADHLAELDTKRYSI